VVRGWNVLEHQHGLGCFGVPPLRFSQVSEYRPVEVGGVLPGPLLEELVGFVSQSAVDQGACDVRGRHRDEAGHVSREVER
jgi:hypothetical protein